MLTDHGSVSTDIDCIEYVFICTIADADGQTADQERQKINEE